MTGEWQYHACELTTGRVVADLSLVEFSGEVNLLGQGAMSARLPLGHLPTDIRREMIAMTTPGRHTIVARRDGIVRGEWVIWQRTRPNTFDPISLVGNEVLSYLGNRMVQAWSWTQVEQLDIAHALVTTGFRGSDWGTVGAGAVVVTVAPYAPSGQKRDRAFKALDNTIGQRLRELAEVDNGFDLVLTPTWKSTGSAGVDRTVRFHYPRAGTALDVVFEMAGVGFGVPTGGGGNILDASLDEDARGLGSRTYAIGATDSDVTTTGVYQDLSLVTTGWPFMEQSASYTSVSEQATIDAYARALWQDSQRMQQPSGGRVLADVPPAIGDYALGDTVILDLGPSLNFPDGYRSRVRVIGWTFKPPAQGPETVQLKISLEST